MLEKGYTLGRTPDCKAMRPYGDSAVVNDGPPPNVTQVFRIVAGLNLPL